MFIVALVAGSWFWRESVKEKQARMEQKQSETTLNADEAWYPIPELGIKMKLNKEFAQDLVYKYEIEKDLNGVRVRDGYTNYPFVRFTTKSLEAIDTQYCTADNSPLGSLTKITNQEMEKELHDNDYYSSRINDPQITKNLSDFFVVFNGPQAVCWDPSKSSQVVEILKKYDGGESKELHSPTNVLNALQTIEVLE